MITREEDLRTETVRAAALRIMAAARTAPKGKGIDNSMIALAEGDTLAKIADRMEKIWKETGTAIFERDAKNVRQSEMIVLIGAKISPIGLNCGLCGFETCEKKNSNKKAPCVFNINDLGIALGSAVAAAADMRVDNRIMYSIGKAAFELELLPQAAVIFGIPLSCTAKSPFFDRK